jgi:hypothetical protein
MSYLSHGRIVYGKSTSQPIRQFVGPRQIAVLLILDTITNHLEFQNLDNEPEINIVYL